MVGNNFSLVRQLSEEQSPSLPAVTNSGEASVHFQNGSDLLLKRPPSLFSQMLSIIATLIVLSAGQLAKLGLFNRSLPPTLHTPTTSVMAIKENYSSLFRCSSVGNMVKKIVIVNIGSFYPLVSPRCIGL